MTTQQLQNLMDVTIVGGGMITHGPDLTRGIPPAENRYCK